MLDLAGILFSSVMMLFIIVRAVRLDQTQPWFQTLRPDQADKAGKEGKNPPPPPRGHARGKDTPRPRSAT